MSSPRSLRLLSVVAPVLNEGEVIEEFHRRLCAALDGIRFELIVVDDGSTDATPQILARLADVDERVRVVELSRNFGYQSASSAGLDHAAGDVVVTIDADLQDPPELIGEMLERWRGGSDVVYAVRRERQGESRMKLLTARWFSRAFARMAELEIPLNAGDFRLLDRRAVDALLRMPERRRFLRGMTVWVGYTQSSVAYDRDPRFAGETRYRWRTLLRISFDAITSFSSVPLQIATLIGFAVSAIAFLGLPYVVVGRLTGIYSVKGLSTLLFAVLFLGGIQLIFLGVIGEYISRIYDEVKGRPLYVVRRRRNVGAPEPDGPGSDPRSREGSAASEAAEVAPSAASARGPR
jgi:polyisoprenyl-phosphate glycosyltransferase